MADDEDDMYEEQDPDPFEEALMNCGLVRNTGLCLKAGSEESDWECPFNQ
jgi:hypothetical protein